MDDSTEEFLRRFNLPDPSVEHTRRHMLGSTRRPPDSMDCRGRQVVHGSPAETGIGKAHPLVDFRQRQLALHAGQRRAWCGWLYSVTRISQQIADEADRQAAGLLAEAGYSQQKLQEQWAKAQAGPNKKLIAKQAPFVQRALDHLERLRGLTEDYRQMDAAEDAAAEAAGLSPQWQKRVRHVSDDPLSPESTIVSDRGFGATPGYATALDAVAAGVDPRSTDLADLARRRVARNRHAIEEKKWQDELFSLAAPDGKPILGGIVETSEKLNPDGSRTASQKLPKGYVAVQAGESLLSVHKDFAPLFKAFYDPSAVRNSPVGRAELKAVAFARKYSLVLDTFHVGRVGFKELSATGKVGYNKGLSILDYHYSCI